MSRTAVITDIHGRLTELEALLAQIPAGARLVFLGDYVDRGTQSSEGADVIRTLHEVGAAGLPGNPEGKLGL